MIQRPYANLSRPAPEGSNTSGQSQMEMDEALARQLQRAEMDGISTPLILGGNREGSVDDARQTRINALQNVREVRSASFALCIVLLVNIPQIVAAVCILARYWNDATCSETETLKWRTYALIAATRMFFYVSTVTALYHLNGRMNIHTRIMRFLSHARNGLDAFGLIWFVVGNMWLFGGDVEICPHPNRSPLYTLCVAMVFINYAQLCLPCVVVIVMLPVLCFCLPCLIRILARIQDPMRGKGATPTMINKLPLMKYRQVLQQLPPQPAPTQGAAPAVGTTSAAGLTGSLNAPSSSATAITGGATAAAAATGSGESNSTSCAICISEYSTDDDVRLLPCHHYFHSSCVDEWLRVNASCPTCRASIQEHAETTTPRYGTTSPHTLHPSSTTTAMSGSSSTRQSGGDQLV